jgi:HrpA-like RNA helicase
MEDVQVPEVHRVPLEQTALQVLALGLGSISAFLGGLVDAPKPEAVAAAFSALVQIGAVDVSADRQDRLTPLGKHLCQLPVDVRVGKMLVFGSVLGCLDAVLTVAAATSRRSPWLNLPPERRQEADAARKVFRTQGLAAGGLSDQLVIVAAYQGALRRGC